MRKLLMLLAGLVILAMTAFVGCESKEASAPAETTAESAAPAASEAPASAETAAPAATAE